MLLYKLSYVVTPYFQIDLLSSFASLNLKLYFMGSFINLEIIIGLRETSNKFKSRRCSIKKAAPENFTKFTGKHMCQSLFFNKVAGFPVNIAKFLRTSILKNIANFGKLSRTSFLQNTSVRLLLTITFL